MYLLHYYYTVHKDVSMPCTLMVESSYCVLSISNG